MNYTENLSLGLPEYGESADVAALNRNSGILDAYVYNTRQMECEPYDPTKTYMSGDLAIHNEVIYECNTDNTTGAWDDSKWDSTTLAEQIAKAKQMGGENALADLDDVEITNPSSGQALLFDDSDDKWKNQNLPDVSVTKEASGNPIELTDAASAPMVKCVTAITGSQDLHGYDKPWVGGAGKNKLEVTGSSTTVSGVTFTVNSDGTILVNGTATAAIQYNVMANWTSFTAGNYILNGCPTGLSNMNLYVNPDRTQAYYDFGSGVSFSVTSEIIVRIYIASGVTANNLLFKPMIRLATETDPTFAPYSNICPITAYTEGEIEVRGKNLFDKADMNNATSSLQTITLTLKANTSYTASTSLPLSSGPTANFFFYPTNGSPSTNYNGVSAGVSRTFSTDENGQINVSYRLPTGVSVSDYLAYNYQIEEGSAATDYEPYTSTTHTTTYPSAIYRGSEDVVNGSETHDMIVNDLGDYAWTKETWGTGVDFYITALQLIIKSPANVDTPANLICSNYVNVSRNVIYNSTTPCISVLPGGVLKVRDSRYDEYTVADFRTAMSGVKIAYELATPTTSPVTPTNLPLKTLFGYNHIESSTGDMEIEYITEGYQSLVDLIQSSKHVYSTQEQIVGTWVDGSITYERTIYISGTLVMESPNTWVDSGVDISYIDRFVSFNAIMVDGSGVPALWGGKSNNHLMLLTSRSNTFNGLYVTIRYTKPIATRSLSAPLTTQKAQIEPLTDKTEEVPTEEEKAVNEEENNDER